MNSQASRNSSITITPSLDHARSYSGGSTLYANSSTSYDGTGAAKSQVPTHDIDPPDAALLPPSTRPRTLYLPHTPQTLRLMLHYLYTSALPPVTSLLCTPQILCSVLQIARPYQIDGLLEATVERLHEVLDGRNAAAVFNASAMAAGGGRGVEKVTGMMNGRRPSETGTINGTVDGARDNMLGRTLSAKTAGLRLDTSFGQGRGRPPGHQRSQSEESAASTSTASVATSISDGYAPSEAQKERRMEKETWTGDVSSVIGLQKRGLRGLMEGRRMRERGNTNQGPGFNTTSGGPS